MKGYRFLPPAEEEITEASFYYQTASSGLGQEFLDDLQRTIEALCERPKLGRLVGRGLRQVTFRRFPFLLIYEAMPPYSHAFD